MKNSEPLLSENNIEEDENKEITNFILKISTIQDYLLNLTLNTKKLKNIKISFHESVSGSEEC